MCLVRGADLVGGVGNLWAGWLVSMVRGTRKCRLDLQVSTALVSVVCGLWLY